METSKTAFTMKLKIVLLGLAILFGSLIGCQQTEKITTKIDTVKLITAKYDTVVINQKDTIVIVNNDTIYNSNPSTTSDGYIKGVYTFVDGTSTDSITLTIEADYGHDHWTYDSTTQTYSFTITRADTYLALNDIGMQEIDGLSVNYIQITNIQLTNNIVTTTNTSTYFHWSVIANNKDHVGYDDYASVTITNFIFNPSTSDLSFSFGIQEEGILTYSGVYKGKCYQQING